MMHPMFWAKTSELLSLYGSERSLESEKEGTLRTAGEGIDILGKVKNCKKKLIHIYVRYSPYTSRAARALNWRGVQRLPLGLY